MFVQAYFAIEFRCQPQLGRGVGELWSTVGRQVVGVGLGEPGSAHSDTAPLLGCRGQQ